MDPFVVLEDRVRGPVDQTVSFAELNLQFNLTGGKTWHRLAPFMGVGGGLTFPSGTAADTSGFELGQQDLFRSARRLPVLPHRPAAPSDRRPGRLLEAQLSRQLHPGAAGRARGPPVITDGNGERVDHVLLAPGRTGLLLLSLARCPSRSTRSVGFRATHRLYRPDWTEERNREAFGPLSAAPGHATTTAARSRCPGRSTAGWAW